MELRMRVAQIVREYARHMMKPGATTLDAADRILSIPEIAEALRATEDGGELDVYRANCTCELD